MESTKMKRNNALDGIRAVAITLVVASHTGILAQGGFGNAMFFCLSGFLSAIPFKDDVEKDYLSVKHTMTYYLNRLIRILPVYYVVIGFVYGLSRGFFSDKIHFLKNMLFMDAYSHLWFLQQEMYMYFCMPFIFILLAVIKRIFKVKYNDLLCAVLLFVMAFLANKYLTMKILYLQGVFRIGQFMIGLAFGYLYKVYRKSSIDISKYKAVKILCELVVFGFLVFTVISSEQILSLYDPAYQEYYIGWNRPMLCTVLTGLAIFALLVHAKGICARILGCKPIAYIGQISFIVYLIHMFLIYYLKFGTSVRDFLGVYAVSICIAAMLHTIVEKPSIILAKTLSMKKVFQYYREL